MTIRKGILIICAVTLCLSLTPQASLRAQSVPTPKSHFGFDLGADGKLASWQAIVDYYRKLDSHSDRVLVRDLGQSTLGNPFPLIVITSSANMARLDRLAEISRTLADPRGHSGAEIDRLIEEGRSVVAVTVGLHATEVAATQMAPGLAYRLATAQDGATRRVLRNTVLLLFGCFNPDGAESVVEWAEKTQGTTYQGSSFPDLYHHYAGHDNNRDSYMLSLKESQMFAKVVYHEWTPQMYLDIHQMGSYAARLYVPPYHDPINANVDPLNWMEHELVGANMQIALERAGVTGVVAGAPYTGWWFPSFHMSANHRNIAGMLTETASAHLAWPVYVHPHQLRPHGRSHAEYEPMQVFPHPWPGGWWRLADMIRQQEVSTWALLETAAVNRRLVLRNRVFKARRIIERGAQGPECAYVIPARQHDRLTVDKLIGVLMQNNIEVHRARADFETDGRLWHAGDYVACLAQPNGALVKSLLAEAHYPDNAITRRADGSIRRPYDMANFVLAEHMGVQAFPVGRRIDVPLEKLTEAPESVGRIAGTGRAGWLLSHRFNDAFLAVNHILANDGEVYWLREAIDDERGSFAPGAIWIPAGRFSGVQVSALARETGLIFHALSKSPQGPALKLKPLRLGMYRRYRGGNMDEGWTRYLFDHWNFPYRRVDVDAIKEGALEELDVFLIPHDRPDRMMADGDGKEPEAVEPEEYPEVFLPPEYKKGLDEGCIEKLKAFVRSGGTLVLMGSSSQLAMDKLGVPVTDVTAGLSEREYFCPGSTLHAEIDVTHPLAYGMPARGLILNWSNPVFAINPSAFNERIAAPVVYPGENILKSGWLVGEKHLAGKAAALDVQYGRGRIIMFGFRPQHRTQTHGTFKMLFNALYYGPAQQTVLGDESPS